MLFHWSHFLLLKTINTHKERSSPSHGPDQMENDYVRRHNQLNVKSCVSYPVPYYRLINKIRIMDSFKKALQKQDIVLI